MADNYVQDMMKRVAAMQIEAVASLKTVDAKGFWPYQQEELPYFTNRWGGLTNVDDVFGEDIDQEAHVILMRLVAAHLTEGYDSATINDASNIVIQYAVLVVEYFRNHPRLTTDSGAYTGEPDYLLQDARLTNHTGVVIFSNSGIGQLQYGTEFTLEIPFLRLVDY